MALFLSTQNSAKLTLENLEVVADTAAKGVCSGSMLSILWSDFLFPNVIYECGLQMQLQDRSLSRRFEAFIRGRGTVIVVFLVALNSTTCLLFTALGSRVWIHFGWTDGPRCGCALTRLVRAGKRQGSSAIIARPRNRTFGMLSPIINNKLVLLLNFHLNSPSNGRKVGN